MHFFELYGIFVTRDVVDGTNKKGNLFTVELSLIDQLASGLFLLRRNFIVKHYIINLKLTIARSSLIY